MNNKDMEKVLTFDENLSKSREQHDRRRGQYMDYIKKLNYAKKDNQTIKNELRKLNKSLDTIIKKQQSGHGPRYLSPLYESEDEINKKIENTEFLISKYKKEINTLKEVQTSSDNSEKLRLNNEILALQQSLKEVELENAELSKGTSHFSYNGISKAEDKSLKKELLGLKEKQRHAEYLTKEDERIISNLKSRIFELRESKSVKSSLKATKEIDESIRYDQEISNLKARIAELEVAKKQEDGIWKLKLQEMSNNLEEKRKEVLQLEEDFKEKDRNCRIKKMQIKAQQRENRLIVKTKASESVELYDFKEN